MAKGAKLEIKTTISFNQLSTLADGEHTAVAKRVEDKTTAKGNVLSILVGELAGSEVNVLAVRKDAKKPASIVEGEPFTFKKYMAGQWANGVAFI
jgi:hypothetical protein